MLRPALALVLSIVVAASLPAQRASGRVFGFDGAPCGGVVVQGHSASGLQTEVLTMADGTFEITLDQPLRELLLQLEGVTARVPVPQGSLDGVVTHFAQQQFTTWTGRLLDPGGGGARDVDLLCRDRRGRTITTVTTSRDGSFVLRSQQAPHTLCVDPCGLCLRVPGPFPAATPLHIDLRDFGGSYFRLHGNCFDDQDRPAAGWRLVASYAGARLASTTTDSDGSFVIWCRRELDLLVASDAALRMGRFGPWHEDTRVDLRERQHGLRIVAGRVVDGGGAAVAGAFVLPAQNASAPPRGTPVLNQTDAEGRFTVRTFHGQPFLFFADELGDRSASIAVPGDGTPVVVTVR
ncbi:MAG: hypothetical protein K8J09_10480 [Planctomycetes bacterium]|nr:hypothetical protein [Planctomycetota bacterium]MCC7399641.1 hypothetical protein [Planctomycetota bacterium]